MATYTFLGGDFDDQHDWNPQGIPGAGDTILDDGAGISAEGETVANAKGINGDPIVIIGGLNITDVGYDLELQDGVYSVGSIEGASIFNGATVTAGSVDLSQPNIALELGDSPSDTSSLTVSDSVVADGDGIDVDTAGTFDVEGGVSITDGYLENDSGATTIGGELGLDAGSYLALYGGTATIGSLNADDSSVGVDASVSGTMLEVSGDVTLSNGASFGVSGGGKAKIETLTAGETGKSTIEVEGAGSILTVVKTLTLGSDGDGALTISDGGALTIDGAFDMAENAGSTSTATIGESGSASEFGDLDRPMTGNGATLTIRGEWQIGVAGTANATINQGLTADALGGITLGVQKMSNGTLTVSQADTVLSVTGDIVIGKGGAGTLNVQDGAIVDAAGSDVTVGEEDAATGAATITGAGSQFETGSLTIGSASTKATVTISSGGDLEIATDLTLGEEAGSKGALKVSDAGSQVSVGGNATLGENGSGTLTMTGGAISVAGAMTLGADKGSSGKLTLSDATLSITGDLNIGEAGSGTATVQLGSILKSKAIEIGGALGAKGSLAISGAGTSVTTGETTIGAGGAGTLKITSGGLLTTNGDATIGSVALGAIVSASLDTGGEWLVGGDLDVGDSGAGTLSIAGKKTLVTVDGDMTIGASAGGTVTLGSTAAASSARLIWDNLLTVGEGAQGTLTINAGDSVSALAGGAGQLGIGADAGSSGTVSLAGTGASLKGTALFVGGTSSEQGGAGSLSVSAGATTTFADATIWATGKATDAGALSISGPLTGSGSVQISGAGQFTLGGSDSTVGIDFVSGGSNERLDLSAAHLPTVGIKGFGANDTIDVSGLSQSDTIGVSYKGAVATVRFLHAGKTVGSLRFAMKAGQGTFHFDAADGALTFAPKADADVTFNSSGGSAASVQEQIFNSALLSDSLGHHAPEAIVERGSATPDLWSVGHAPAG